MPKTPIRRYNLFNRSPLNPFECPSDLSFPNFLRDKAIRYQHELDGVAGPQGFEPWVSGLSRSPAPKASALIQTGLRARSRIISEGIKEFRNSLSRGDVTTLITIP